MEIMMHLRDERNHGEREERKHSEQFNIVG